MTIDPQRLATMCAIKSGNTKPKIEVRSLLHRNGYRFRLHRKDLPGKPDIAFPSRNQVVLVHGCFWHGHSCRRGRRVPQNNRDYRVEKVRQNVERDAFNFKRLTEQGWHAFVVWECQIGCSQLMENLSAFLADPEG